MELKGGIDRLRLESEGLKDEVERLISESE